jgi:cell wall-associated NlpC family hydrolase
VAPFARPAAADQLSSDQAQAAQLEQEIAATGRQIDALDQQYQQAEEQKQAIDQQIATTESKISEARQNVSGDQAVLRKAAVDAYMNDGNTTNPLFSGAANTELASREYDNVAEGNLGTAVSDLRTSENKLGVQEDTLHSQDSQAAAAVAAAQAAKQQAQTMENQQNAALHQVSTQITALIKQQQAAAAAAAAAAAEAQIAAAQAAAARRAAAAARSGVTTSSSDPPPPSAGGAGTAAVAAAESQIGVPYVWGAESPGSGFDCSGLTAWAWGQAGVSLPHYSGAQMADSAPVPISDLEPGDLLFYGPGGSEHVAMYVGGGQMIEAPYTGASVWITGLRIGTGSFAGAGRP